MHFYTWMVLAAAMLPYVTVGLAKAGGFDNASPRLSLAKLKGWRARAEWAHRNHLEAFPVFAAGVIFARMRGAPPHVIDVLAGSFIALRIAYTGAYIGDLAWQRSVIWFAALGCAVALFVVG